MSTRGIAIAAGTAVGVLLVALLVLTVGLRDGAPEPQRDPDALPDLRSGARASFSPAVHRFGEDVTATIELRVPKGELQLDTLEPTSSFDPYEVVDTRREVLDAGERWLVRYAIQLRCLKEDCLPRGESRDFEPGSGGFTWSTPPPPGRRLKDRRLDARRVSFSWPTLTVVSRLGPDDARDVRWRSTLAALPEPDYPVSPRRLSAILLGGAVGLVVVAGLLVAAWLRSEWRAAAAVTAVEIETPPLEQALALVGRNGDGDGRRLALQTLAHELRRGGDPALAEEAERLAWSEDEPDERAVGALTSAVRHGAAA